MCGLIANFCVSTDKKKKAAHANQFIIDQFEDQHSRGVKGFGIIRIGKTLKVEVDRACETSKFLLDLYLKNSSMIVAHHRTPTSTDNKLDQTHPMFISNEKLKYDYHVVHNGIISNDVELHTKHEELGFLYKTEYQESYYAQNVTTKFNDSEAIAIELALFIEGMTDKVGCHNKAAFIIVQMSKETKKVTRIFFGKNDNGDLTIDRRENELRLSSEGEGDDVLTNVLFSFDPADKKMELAEMPIPFKTFTMPAQVPSAYDKWKASETARLVLNAKTTSVEITKEEPKEREPIDIVPLAGKGYLATTCIEFKEEIKGMNTIELTHTLDDAIDQQITNAEELLMEYKALTMSQETDKYIEEFYTGQIAEMMRAIRVLANIATKEYNEKLLIEEVEAAEVEATEKANGIDKTDPRTSSMPTSLEEWEQRENSLREEEMGFGYG